MTERDGDEPGAMPNAETEVIHPPEQTRQQPIPPPPTPEPPAAPAQPLPPEPAAPSQAPVELAAAPPAPSRQAAPSPQEAPSPQAAPSAQAAPSPEPTTTITVGMAAGWTRDRIRQHPLLTLAIVALVVAFYAVLLIAPWRPGGASPTKSGTGGSAAQAITAKVTSVDPSGGSGFSRDGGNWRTQTYRSRTFGNLKDGVGLLLDLGSAHNVSVVTVPVIEGPLDIELRAGDSAGGAADLPKVAAESSASGSVKLDGSKGGKHRYWLVWVTRLGSADRAVLGNPVVRAR